MSRNKKLLVKYRIANYGFMVAMIAVIAAMDFDLVPERLAQEAVFIILLVAAPVVGYFATWVGAGNAVTKFCARCGKDIGRRYRYARRIPSRHWWGLVIACEDCVREEDFLLSLPNREYSYRNARLMAHWKRAKTACFVLLVSGFAVFLFVAPGIQHVGFCVALAFLWLRHRTASARSSYYRKAHCAICARDFEPYEERSYDPNNASVFICEQCAEARERAKTDYGGDDDDGEMSFS